MQYSSRVIIFPRYFSTNVFIVVVEVFANKTLKNAHCKQNVLHACVQPSPLFLLPLAPSLLPFSFGRCSLVVFIEFIFFMELRKIRHVAGTTAW